MDRSENYIKWDNTDRLKRTNNAYLCLIYYIYITCYSLIILDLLFAVPFIFKNYHHYCFEYFFCSSYSLLLVAQMYICLSFIRICCMKKLFVQHN